MRTCPARIGPARRSRPLRHLDPGPGRGAGPAGVSRWRGCTAGEPGASRGSLRRRPPRRPRAPIAALRVQPTQQRLCRQGGEEGDRPATSAPARAPTAARGQPPTAGRTRRSRRRRPHGRSAHTHRGEHQPQHRVGKVGDMYSRISTWTAEPPSSSSRSPRSAAAPWSAHPRPDAAAVSSPWTTTLSRHVVSTGRRSSSSEGRGLSLPRGWHRRQGRLRAARPSRGITWVDRSAVMAVVECPRGRDDAW